MSHYKLWLHRQRKVITSFELRNEYQDQPKFLQIQDRDGIWIIRLTQRSLNRKDQATRATPHKTITSSLSQSSNSISKTRKTQVTPTGPQTSISEKLGFFPEVRVKNS